MIKKKSVLDSLIEIEALTRNEFLGGKFKEALGLERAIAGHSLP
jgi:hypothetical protein